MLTKTDFMTYVKSPMHLWAKTHDRIEESGISDFNEFINQQGYAVEECAQQFIHSTLLPRYPQAELIWQNTYRSGDFQCRCDAIVYDKKEKVYDVYEVKQSTKLDSDDEYDLTFQTLIYEMNFSVRNVHILHLSKDYVRQGEINLEQLFVITNLNEKVAKRRSEVLLLRELALKVLMAEDPTDLDPCTSPIHCPCPTLCHPLLPTYSIYDLMGAKKPALLKLHEFYISQLTDIGDEIFLNEKQQNQIQAVKDQKPYIDTNAIKAELKKLIYPLYFFDYETCLSAVPQFDGYKPQQPMVFQYSLHIVTENGEDHKEYLSITKDDPAPPLLKKLSTEIGPVGSVIVWHKPFEMSRNKEMAERYPEYREFLEGVNERVYDLAESCKKGYLIHPDFHGSWSIKNVLPVLVPALSYKEMAINKGDQAMVAWRKLIETSNDQMATDMLAYCKLDTLAMVEIWRYFTNLTL